MTSAALVLLTVNVDPDVDEALRTQAAQSGKSKGEMFRCYLTAGMARAQRRRERTVLLRNDIRLCMRTVYLPHHLNTKLRVLAFELGTSKTDLIRRFLQLGMMAMQQRRSSSQAR